MFSAKQERQFLPAFNEVPPSVSATKPAPDVILMNHSIPEGITLTVSTRWRQSLGKVPGALSLSAAPARPVCALPARAQEERRRRGAARRHGPLLLGRSWGAPIPLPAGAVPLPRPAVLACKDRDALQPCAGRAGPLGAGGGRGDGGGGAGKSCQLRRGVQPQRL